MEIRYNLNADGFITEIGYMPNYAYVVDDTCPFDLGSAQFYQKVDNTWIYKKPTIEWHESNWKYRIFLTNDQLAYLALNFFDMVLSFNTAPINPRYDFGDKVLVYLNTLTDEGRVLLDSMSINIEKRN